MVLLCGDQKSAADLTELALEKFNIRVAPEFKVLPEHLFNPKCPMAGCEVQSAQKQKAVEEIRRMYKKAALVGGWGLGSKCAPCCFAILISSQVM